MKKNLIILLIIQISSISLWSQSVKNSVVFSNEKSFEQFMTGINELVLKNELDQAYSRLEQAKEKSEDKIHLYRIFDKMAELSARQKKYDRCKQILHEGLEKKFYFGLQRKMKRNEFYKPFKENNDKEFVQLIVQDNILKKELNEKNTLKYEILLPEKYNKSKNYPMIFIFHGGNCDIKIAKERWISAYLSKYYIRVFLQSSNYGISMLQYIWPQKNEKMNSELKDIFQNIIQKYSPDKTNIITAGMSNGGMMAIQAAFSQIIPAKAFIGICPIIPRDIKEETVNDMRNKVQKAAIITGENDYALKRQQKMIEMFKNTNFPHQFTIIPGMGHEFPQDIDAYIPKLIGFISQ